MCGTKFVHSMVGWVGLVVGQETKWINPLIPHKGKQGEDVWATDCRCQKPVKIRLHDALMIHIYTFISCYIVHLYVFWFPYQNLQK